MRTRPWPLVFLALMHFLGPLGNLVLCAELSDSTLSVFVQQMFQERGVWGLIDFFVLLPVAGYAIWCCRKWSYPVFLAISAQTIYTNLQTWQDAPGVFTLPMLVGTVILDAVFVGYFLIPAVRETYMNSKVRWWESQPRYPVKIPGTVKVDGKKTPVKCTLRNVSEGGAFIFSSTPLDAGDELDLTFSVLEAEFEVRAEVVYAKGGKARGFGLRFTGEDPRMPSRRMRRLIVALRLMGVKPLNRVDWRLSLLDWSRKVVTEGTGLVPKLETGGNVIPIHRAKSSRGGKASRADRVA